MEQKCSTCRHWRKDLLFRPDGNGVCVQSARMLTVAPGDTCRFWQPPTNLFGQLATETKGENEHETM